ncbi:unnamed protein product [Chrysoparadoxa australica]
MSAAAARRWSLDLRLTQRERSSVHKEAPKPPGFSTSGAVMKGAEGGKSEAEQANLKLKRAMELAMGPGKSVVMQGFMMWMSGKSVNIFSILITGTSFATPTKQILNMGKVFGPLEDGKTSLLLPKLVFLGLNFLGIATALYKCGTLGLLPLTGADWLGYLTVKSAAEHSGMPL